MKQLIASELRYRRLFEAAQDGILILDARTGMIEDVNPYLIQMLGYSREEFIEKKLWEVGVFKDIEASKEDFEVLQNSEYIRYEDLPLKAKDGRLIQVEFISNVYLAGDEKVIQCNIRDITEHQRIVLALKANEKKYHDLINQSPDGYFIIELSGNILSANKAMCKELEFSEEEFLSMNIWDIIPEQYLYQYKERLTKVLKGESLKEATEYKVRGKNGSSHYVEVLSAPRYSGRDLIGFQGIARDVTARKRTEDSLLESEAKFRRLVAHLPSVVYINALGDTSTTLYVSPQIEAMLGYTPQEWLANPQSWSKALHPEDCEYVMKQAALTDKENKPFDMEYRMIARDGRLVWVHDEIVLVNDLEDQPQFWQGIMLDITEQKRAEEQARFQAALLNAVGQAVIATDAAGTVTYVNRAIEKLYGWRAEDAEGRNILEVTVPQISQTQASEIMTQLSQGGSWSGEFLVQHRDGRIFPALVHDSPVFNPSGELVGIIGISSDITERKQAEEKLRNARSFLQGVQDSLSAHIAILDHEGNIVQVNAAWRDFGEQNALEHPNYCVGMNYLDVCLAAKGSHAAEARLVANAIRDVQAGGRSETGIEYPCHAPQEQRWFVARITSFESNDRTWIVVAHEDITVRKAAEEAVREKERLLSEAQKIGRMGSWSYNISANTLQFSDEMYRLFDISAPEFQHDRAGFLTLIYSADQPQVMKWMDDIRTGRQVKELSFRIFLKNGELRYIQCRGVVRFDPQGHPVHFIGIAQDVTERKLAEIQIQQQLEHLTALGKIDQAIISTFDLGVMMEAVLAQVIAQLQVDAADVLLLEGDSQVLKYFTGSGFRIHGHERPPVPVGQSLAGRVAKEKHILRIENLNDLVMGAAKGQADDPFVSSLVAKENFVSYFGVPLTSNGKVTGVLEIFHRTTIYPYAEWVDFLNALAGQAAIAIENASLFGNLELSNRELSQAYDATIEGWSRALDLRDKETEGHTLRVTKMTLMLAKKFNFTDTQMRYIRWGGLLHDIGKMGIPDSILLKPDKLTAEEWEIMRKHPLYSYMLLEPIDFLKPALDIPYCHHEKWDGTGYPRALKDEEIPLQARIFAVVDVWDALCSDRPYRPGWPEEKVRDHIRSLSGTHFDPQIVDIFMQFQNDI